MALYLANCHFEFVEELFSRCFDRLNMTMIQKQPVENKTE